MSNTALRPINKIAAEILTEWGPDCTNPRKCPAYQNFALPYVWAMLNVSSVKDKYGLDTADDIVLRFLSNVQQWRGEAARRIKAELNSHLKAYSANYHSR